MKIKAAFLIMILSACTTFGQTINNFDRMLTPEDSSIVIQPPPGRTWTLVRGSFVVANPIPGASLTVYEQYGEDRFLCTNLIRASLWDNAWVPIIRGFVAHQDWGYLWGLPDALVLTYPMRLVIAVTGIKTPTESWTRFTVIEGVE